MQLPHRVAHAVELVAGLPAPAQLAFGLEFFLLASHAQVLLALGPSHSFESLKSRRAYFVVDLLSPWAALTAVALSQPAGVAAIPPTLWLMCVAHAVLHAFYIATWHTQHTERVIRLSSDDAPWQRRFQGWKERRGGKYGPAELAWFLTGTSFDMLIHAAVMAVLLKVTAAAAALQPGAL